MTIIKKLRNSNVGMIIWIFISIVVLYFMIGNESIKGVSLPRRIVTVIVAVVITIPSHEIIHAIVMKLFSKGKVTIKLKPIKLKVGGFGFRTVLQGDLKKWQKFIMFISPFLVLTVLPASIICLLGRYSLFFYFVAVANFAGAYFDILDAILLFEKNDNA